MEKDGAMKLPKQEVETKQKGSIFVPEYDEKSKEWKLVHHDEQFEMPKKLYGDVIEYTECVKINFHDYKKQTGCLFLGAPGTGKTLQAKHICNALMELGYDVLYIYGSLADESIISFLNKTTYLGVIYIDEAAKVITGRNTNGLEGLLSTMSDTKYHRCWILTENRDWRLPNDMLNRPGRFLFKRTYGRVTEDIIREACKDFGAGEKLADELVERNAYCADFTLDMLMSLLETHIKFPNLTLDDFTEKFSFDGLRIDMGITNTKVFYDNHDITAKVGYRNPDEEEEDNEESVPKSLTISPNVRTDLLGELNLKVIESIVKKAKPFYIALSGSFHTKNYEDWVKGKYKEREEAKSENDMPFPPGQPNKEPSIEDFYNRGRRNRFAPAPEMATIGFKFDKETQDRLDKVKTTHGFKVNVYDVVHYRDEKKILCYLSKRLRLELSYDVAPLNPYLSR